MKNYEINSDKGEVYIYNPETGKSWYNQLWNKFGYHMTVTHTGLVHSRIVDDRGIQVLLNKPESNCLYLRNDDTGEFWNIGILPVGTNVDNYKCTHAAGWTEIVSEYKGIEAHLMLAVSNVGTYEMWRVRLINKGDKEVNLSLFTGVEFALDGFDMPAYYNAETTTETVYDEKNRAILCLMKNPFRPHDNTTGFIMTSEQVAAYDGNYEAFMGTIGGPAFPRVIKSGGDCTNSLSTVRRRGGILQSKITVLPSGEKSVTYVLGFTTGQKAFAEAAPEIMKAVQTELENADAEGKERFGRLRTKCPEQRIDNIMNFWAQKQVSFCMIGKKAVRDNAQLAMAMLNFDTELAELTLTECLSHQFLDGHSLLNWQIASDRLKLYADPPMWLILSVCEYIKETGNFEFLNKLVEFEDGEAQSIYNHLKLAAEWYLKPQNIGKHGIPKIHYADWNDALNIPDNEAESVFMAMSVSLAFGELAELSETVGDNEFAEHLRKNKKRLREVINKEAFNGDYYIRAMSKFGNVGDKDCEYGKIYINPQTWAIMSEVYEEENLEKLLNSIDAMENERGIPLCIPAYKEYDNRVGRMSGMLPGVFENAGIYNHACGFKIMADCKLKRTENAVATLLKAIPDGEVNPSELTTTEPYVFTNCYLQHDAVDMKVGFSWQTGTSAWMLRDYYEGILGLKRSYDGLKIEPCIPKKWDKVYAERHFRGNLLKISYEQTGGDLEIFVDGVKINGNTITEFADNREHSITVKM